ncbi:MAG: chromosome segregation protein SMC, partial [Planctomycetes bacterium]|nr:chromosome segregation protein SMC [Planctomycetota bacterium]
MYLKQVTLYGFKSFADRTVFDMSKGITAVLGPNGCGKSNVIDAIKWVLGESSAKNLRGTQMQDVIFAGSAGRKPLGMAEVSLVFNNDDGALPIDYNEVCITRRLYRSGESEYEINKQPCRKRDIRDLLLDTGIGMSAYSFIEQGRVEALLQAKPAERRLVIEEAAGISKYKVRRKESLARLERTNQSLLRVNDIVEEIEKNVARVGRQAKNAKRHLQLTTDLRRCKELHYTRLCAGFIRQLGDLERQKQGIQDLYASATARATELTALISQLTEEEMELAAKVEAGEKEYREIQTQLNDIQVELASGSERCERLRAEKNDAEQRAAALRTKLAQLADGIAAARADLEKAEAELAAHQATLSGQDGVRGDLQRLLDECETTIAQKRQEILDVTARKNEIHTLETQLETRAADLQARLSEHESGGAALQTREEQLRGERDALQSRYDAAKTRFDELNAQVNAARDNEKRLRQEAEAEKDGLAAKRERVAQLSSRRAALQELEDAHDGAFAGVKAALSAKNKGERLCQDIVGMVADLLTIPREYATALETVLGGAAQNIVTRTARGASDCINYLKSNRAGRATFLPLDRITPRQPLREDLLKQRGVVGEAFDLVDFDDANQKAVEYLLNGVLVVDNLDVARELSGGAARGVRIVTLDGEDISPHGAMTGGQGNQQRGGIIARKAEKDALTTQIAELQQSLDRAAAHSQELLAQAAAAEKERGEAEAELTRQLQAGAAAERERSVKQSEYDRALADREGFEATRERLCAELKELTAGADHAAEKAALGEREAAAGDALAAAITAQKEAREKLDAL